MRTTERLEVSGTGTGFVGQNSLQMVHVGDPHSLHALMMGGLFGQSGQSVTGAAPLGMVGLAQQNIAAILHAQHAAALQSAGTESLASQQLLLLSAYQSHEHDIRNGKDATDEDMEDGRRGDTWNDGEMSGSEEGIHENKEGGVGCWVNSNLQVSLDGGSSHKRNIVYTKAKRGVYTALREFVDQDMEQPTDKRMQDIIEDLRKVQSTEKPVGNKEWVLCDGCEKWRKIPKGFKFDRSKNFFCNMIPKLTCDAKEESWEQNENDCRFIDADWVLASWDRMKRELFKEKNKIDSAAKIAHALKAKTNAGASMVREQLLHEERGGGHALGGGGESEEQSASTESTSEAHNGERDGSEMQTDACCGGGVTLWGGGDVGQPVPAASTPYPAAASALEKVEQFLSSQADTYSKWKINDNVEAKDSTGRWYRASVRLVSFSRRQVKINFGGWDSRWDEWIRVKDRRVRDIQYLDAPRIKTDGTPIWPKGKKKDVDEMEEVEMEEVEQAQAPAKMTREDQRNFDRMRRVEEEEKKRQKREQRKNAPPSAKQVFIVEESARLMKENKALRHPQAKEIAKGEWRKRTGAAPEMEMGIILGSMHQLYACLDEETIQVVAEKLKVDGQKLLQMNEAVYPGMKIKDKLMEGTLLKLPLRLGSGDSKKEIKVLCKVQAVKNILTFVMKESETIKALKKRVYSKEDIKTKEQTVVFANQRLDDEHTLADYNISDESLVVIQVGSHMQAVESSSDAQEVEYDSRWMLSAAGRRFLDTKEGQAWLKTKAGLEWQRQKKDDEREELKERRGAQKGKEREGRGESEPGAALKKFHVWHKAEASRLREQQPHMSQKAAADAARWTWKVYAGPSTYKHRAAFGKMPSVVTWNAQNLNRKDEGAEGFEQDAGSVSGEGESTPGGISKKRCDVVASEQINSIIKSNTFSTSYDWSYRESHLSRTAKKVARISLTTDTLDLITCGLEGLDDRYDGSGWTTWKKKDSLEAKKKKFNKDGSEKKPRNVQPKVQTVGHLAPPKQPSTNVPRWLKGVARCPDLLLPKDDEPASRAQKPPEHAQETVSEHAAKQPSQREAAMGGEGHALGGNGGGGEEDDFFATLAPREKKRQLEMLRRVALIAAPAGGVTPYGGEGRGAPPPPPAALVSPPPPLPQLPQADVKVEALEYPTNTRRRQEHALDGGRNAQEHALGQSTDVCMQEKAEEEEKEGAQDSASDGVAADGVAAVAECSAADGGGLSLLLALPTSAQMAAANVEGDSCLFRLPYVAARYKMQKEFDDYVCCDSNSEFPTPFVPISKNEYVDEEKAYRLPLSEGKCICQCIYVPGTPETACGEQSNCLLRDIYIECGDRCPCGMHCLNKRLRKRQWTKCSIFLTSNGRGWALRNDEPIVTGQLVMEYVGEVICGEEVDLRSKEYQGKRHTYLLKLNHEEFIDSTRKGNLARFINHCCEPNCVMQKWNVGGVQRVGLFAKYPIPAGSELTFDYDMEFYGSEDVKCLCGAPKCRGTLGKENDDGGKGKSKGAAKGNKNCTAAPRKSGAAANSPANSPAGRIRGGSSSKDVEHSVRKRSGLACAKDAKDVGLGGKRKEPEAAREKVEDEFFDTLGPREKKRQMEILKKIRLKGH